MMNWKPCVICVVLLGALIFALPSARELPAQDTPQTSSQAQDIHELVELLREEKLLQELELDDEKTEPLLNNLRTGRRLKNSYLLQQHVVENELAALVNYPAPDQDAIDTVLQKLERAKIQYYQALLKNDQELRKLLSPEEQARYLLFQRKFNKQLKELVAKVRRRHEESEESATNQILRRQSQESVIRKPR